METLIDRYQWEAQTAGDGAIVTAWIPGHGVRQATMWIVLTEDLTLTGHFN